MFIYHTIHNNTVLLVEYTYEDYYVSYHHMEQDGREMITFVQSRRANNDDIERFQQWLEPQLEQFQVLNPFRDTLRDSVMGRAIRVSMLRWAFWAERDAAKPLRKSAQKAPKAFKKKLAKSAKGV